MCNKELLMQPDNTENSILIVDDVPENITVLRKMLTEHGYRVRPALNGEIALKTVGKCLPDLILLDIMMPGMDGYEVCRKLKSQEHTRNIPVIFISALGETGNKIRGFQAGGLDYITKPFKIEEVLARIRIHLELRAMQKKLQEQNRALKEAACLQENVDLIMRHDLKGPISSIISIPSLIMQDTSLKSDHLASLRMIEDAGLRMLQMVNLSLVLFKIERGTYEIRHEAVNLNEILNKVKTECREITETRNIEIRIEQGIQDQKERLTMISGEDLLCHTIFSNLIRNAVEASPENMTVTVTIEKSDLIQISIQNYGSVPESLHEIFFDKYITHGKAGGTGLGTYSARLITQAHGGTIRLEIPTPDQTRIVVSLKPAPSGLPAASEQTIPKRSIDVVVDKKWLSALTSKLYVLIADDDPHNREVVARFIKHPAIQVETAANGKDAVTCASRRNYDVIFMDLEMPVMGGLEATQEIRRIERHYEKKRTPVIALSAHDLPAFQKETLEKGFSGYLIKPVNRSILFSVIRQCVEARDKIKVTPELFNSTAIRAQSTQLGDDRVSYVVNVDQDLEDLMPEYLQRKESELADMEMALKENDYQKIIKQAHALKGSWSLYGFNYLADLGKQIENEAFTENNGNIMQVINDCRNFLDRMELHYVDFD